MAANSDVVAAVQRHFGPLLGLRISRYETAELLLEDGTWSSWPDLPIRIHCDSSMLVSVSWSRFDDLWLANDESLPFAEEDSTTRWVENRIERIKACLGSKIIGVMLGRGEMSVEGRDVEIWTRLAIDVGDGWLEVFNALDENGYDFHETMPAGEFIRCI